MPRRPGMPVLRTVFAGALFACLSFISTGYISALSSDVTLNVPVGTILVQGKTSPHAQIKIYENGNEQPAASIAADASGAFNVELPQDAEGIVDISLRAVDSNGKQSVLVTKQVAVIAHQTSTLNIIMPPTVTASPGSAVFQTGTITFSGQTIPNAAVRITVEPSTILTTTSDNQGNYTVPLLVQSLPSVGVYTFGIEVEIGSEISDYVVAGEFIISPPTPPPVAAPTQPLQRMIRRLARTPVSAPEITHPSEDEYTKGEPFILSGQADPGALIALYDDGTVIGTVIANEAGEWRFYFSPYKKRHTLYAKACNEASCSENSRTVTIIRPDSATLPACRPGVTLSVHRITTRLGEQTELSGTFSEESTGVVYIAWGDESSELFDIQKDKPFLATHTYDEAGAYSGFVIADNGKSCKTATYFTVEVSDDTLAASSIAAIAIVTILFAAVAWVIRSLLIKSRASS